MKNQKIGILLLLEKKQMTTNNLTHGMEIDIKILVSSDQKLALGGRLMMKKSVRRFLLRMWVYHALIYNALSIRWTKYS